MNELQNYQIKFVDEQKVISTVDVKNGQLIKQIPSLKKKNHLFLGWLLNNEVFDFSTVISSDLELIANWKAAPNKITYEFGEVYTSKEQLFRDFFTDFYNYLGKYYPTSIKDYSLNEFLNIASDWNYGNGTMSGFGALFSKYYLVETIDGLVEEQNDAGFIGYCYKNNKYRSFIKFIITFFAYWRTDEDYTTIDNRGNDFFFSGWAALVDTCKFFYLNYETLFHFQRTERLLNCFVDIDSVVDASNLTLEVSNTVLPNLKRRGYVFEGWFLDSDFNNSITELKQNMTNVTLYPKWSKESLKLSYLDKNYNLIKEENYNYQDYINADSGYVYIDKVENSETYRIIYYSKKMPLINEIVLIEKK